MQETTSVEQQLKDTLRAGERALKVFAQSLVDDAAPSARKLVTALSIWSLGLGLLVATIYALIVHQAFEPAAWLFAIALAAFVAGGVIFRNSFRSNLERG